MLKIFSKTQSGFTLFELLVSIAIFTLLTTTLLVKNSQFRGNTLVTNLAYEIALAIRQAQVYGLNVRGEGGNFSYAYGVHFDLADPNNFILFADSVGNNLQYDADAFGTDTIIETFKLPPGNVVTDFCVEVVNAAMYCAHGDKNSRITTLDTVFKRPDPESKISAQVSSVQRLSGAEVRSAIIYIGTAKEAKKRITVSSSGQISVAE